MKYKNIISAMALCLGAVSLQAQANFDNGSFENGFSQWLATDHAYLVTQNGNVRTRHDYQNYLGWEGADVWFSSPAADGQTFAVFGSNGNESDGSVLSDLWTVSNQYVSFSHAGNNTSMLQESERAYASILSSRGTELTRLYVTGYNDSQWRNYSIDLTSLGLIDGDTFSFYYVDGASWSVLDNVTQTGPSLTVSDVPLPAGIAAFGLLGLGLLRVRRKV